MGSGGSFAQNYIADGTITAGHLVVLDSSNDAIEVTAGATSGVIGVATNSATIGLAVSVAYVGQAPIIIDAGACTQGQYIVISASTNGLGKCQSSTPSGTEEIAISFSTIGASGQVNALLSIGNSNSASGIISGQVLNQIPYATGPSTIGGTITCNVTGYLFAGINGAPPACNPTGAVGPQISTTPYSAQCDSTTTLDRGTTLKFVSGSATLVVPRPGDSGCANFHFAVEVEISSLTVNREAGASYTFSIHNGSTTTTGATTLTLTTGEWAFFKQDNYGCSPESTCIMDVDEVTGGGSVSCSGLPALTGDTTSSAGSCATSTVKVNGAAIPASVPLASNGSSQIVTAVGTRKWQGCEGRGLGDGLNAIPAGTYLQSTCYNDTGVTVTITGVKCYVDGGSSSTLNGSGNTLGALLTGAVTCSTSYAAGTQSANVLLTSGDYIKFTFVADGTAKQTDWLISGTY